MQKMLNYRCLALYMDMIAWGHFGIPGEETYLIKQASVNKERK